MSEGYAIILLNNERKKMSNIRQVEHTIKLIAEFDTDTMPLDIAYAMTMLSETELNKILAETFIASIDHISGLEKINAGNQFATIKWGNN